MLRAGFLIVASLTSVSICAQPGGPPPQFDHTCLSAPPDSVDVTNDGIVDFVVLGFRGVSTCDKPVSIGSCEVLVLALPGTQLLAQSHPMGGYDIHGFKRGETIMLPPGRTQQGAQQQPYAFRDGAVRALVWSYGRSGISEPRIAPMADRTFVFATTVGERTTYGSFTLKPMLEERTVRIVVGPSPQVDRAFVVR